MHANVILQIFENPVDHAWTTYRINELSEPVYGRIFRIEPLSGTPPIGLGFELQGCGRITHKKYTLREDVKIPTYKPHTNHKRSSVRSHTLAPTSICDLSHSLCWRPLTDLGQISSVTYVCHPLWFVCGHRKGILMSALTNSFFLIINQEMS